MPSTGFTGLISSGIDSVGWYEPTIAHFSCNGLLESICNAAAVDIPGRFLQDSGISLETGPQMLNT